MVGLIVDTAELKRFGAPIMGIALLLALGVIAARAITSRSSDAEQELEATRA